MIPNKSNFKFQELTSITGVKPYVIRYWETEFDEISPVASDSGQKLYSRKDVEFILNVKKLLFEDKFSIAEAKLALRNGQFPSSAGPHVCHDEESKSKEMVFLKASLLDALNLIREIKNKHHW